MAVSAGLSERLSERLSDRRVERVTLLRRLFIQRVEGGRKTAEGRLLLSSSSPLLVCPSFYCPVQHVSIRP